MANKKYILANNLLIQLNDNDYDEGLGTAMIDEIDGSGDLKSAFIDKQTKQAYLQFNKPIRLKNGIDTLCDRYNLSKIDTVRLNVPRPAPNSLLDMMFASSGYDPDRLIKVWGKEMSPEALMKRYSKKCANALVTAKTNQTIVNSTTADMVEKGLVGMGNTLGQVAQSKAVLRKATAQEEMDARPLCVDPVELTFRKVDVKTREFADGYEPYTLTLVPYPYDTDVKFKHYYIFSKKPSWGKSYVLREKLVKRYRAGKVQSINNACNLLEGVQFLVVDEYSQTRSMDLAELKGLTSGDASDGKLNRKSFGDCYVPRPDMQLVILSNHSPYQVYAKYNKKYGRRYIGSDEVDAIHDRFHVHMLDGDLQDELDEWMNPEGLSPEDAMRRFKKDAAGLVKKFGKHYGTVVDLFEHVTKRIKWYDLSDMTRKALLANFPRKICGGLRTADVANVLLEPDTIKLNTTDKPKIKQKLKDLKTARKRKWEGEDDIYWDEKSKRPRMHVNTMMLHTICMSNNERRRVLKQYGPVLRRELREDIEKCLLDPQKLDSFDLTREFLTLHFGAPVESLVTSDIIFSVHFMATLAKVVNNFKKRSSK